MTRRKLRDSIFKILFRVEFNEIDEMQEQIEFGLEVVNEPEDYDEDKEQEELLPIEEVDSIYITDKVKAVIDNLEEIDNTIVELSEGWGINRIGKTELAILRLAIYEIRFDSDIPDSVAINEAVELAKIYCQESAKSFVNGVLARVVAK